MGANGMPMPCNTFQLSILSRQGVLLCKTWYSTNESRVHEKLCDLVYYSSLTKTATYLKATFTQAYSPLNSTGNQLLRKRSISIVTMRLALAAP